MIIITISFILFFIGVLYSDDPGFYSRELLSGGSDDFYLFIGLTKLNIYGIIFGIANIIVNLILHKKYNKIIHFSSIIYIIIFINQLIGLILINYDTDLLYVFSSFDLFSLWFIFYILGITSTIYTEQVIKKSDKNAECIKINILFKLLIIVIFIGVVILTWKNI
ncbi:MAG: hypothetical protein FWC01_07175 [Treponema sp.]|nr:hypothetical protein [Treponema sp.]MCL2237638.1 hypothetical protein [Treponema sp.]